MIFLSSDTDFTKWVKIKFSDLSPYLRTPLCLCVSVFKYRYAGKFQLPFLGLVDSARGLADKRA